MMNHLLAVVGTDNSTDPMWLKLLNIGFAPALLAATAWFGVKRAQNEYRTKFLTEEWHDLLELLLAHPRFMNPALTDSYVDSFSSDELVQYEMIARICIDYVDDVHMLGTTAKTREWFREGVKVFVAPHRAWFTDHASDFRVDLVDAVKSSLASSSSNNA